MSRHASRVSSLFFSRRRFGTGRGSSLKIDDSSANKFDDGGKMWPQMHVKGAGVLFPESTRRRSLAELLHLVNENHEKTSSGTSASFEGLNAFEEAVTQLTASSRGSNQLVHPQKPKGPRPRRASVACLLRRNPTWGRVETKSPSETSSPLYVNKKPRSILMRGSSLHYR